MGEGGDNKEVVVVEGMVSENNEVFGPPMNKDTGGEGGQGDATPVVEALAPASLSPIHLSCRSRRWPIVYHGPSTTVDGKHWCGRGRIPRTVQRFVDVRLEAVTDVSVVCPIAQDAIVEADRDAPFFPPGTTYSQSMPSLNAVVLGCEHRFSALHLLYHWVRNMTVKCPVCRRGVDNAHLRQSTLPTHLRTELLARTRRERRKDKEEAISADLEVAQSIAAAQQHGIHMGVPPVAEAPRRFIPELGTFDPGSFSPLHVIMGFTIPLVDNSTSEALLSRADIIPSMAVSWATLPAGRGALSVPYRARVHRELIGSGFGQVPQMAEPAALAQALAEVGAGGSSDNDNNNGATGRAGPMGPPAQAIPLSSIVPQALLQDASPETLASYSLLRSVVFVDAFFSVIPWCLSRVSGACIELFLERGMSEGAANARGERDVVALFRNERLSVSFGCRSGMWSMRGGVVPHDLPDGQRGALPGDEFVRLNPPRLVLYPMAAGGAPAVAAPAQPEAMDVDADEEEEEEGEEEEDEEWQAEEGEAEEEEEEDEEDEEDDESNSRFENDEIARILFSASTVGGRYLGLLPGHPFRVVGGIDAMRFPSSELLSPSAARTRDGLVDLSPSMPDLPLRYLVEMQHGVVREVFFEVRLDLFCLLALEQEHIRQTALFQAVPSP